VIGADFDEAVLRVVFFLVVLFRAAGFLLEVEVFRLEDDLVDLRLEVDLAGIKEIKNLKN
jgi:hypothetical protein